MDIRLNRTDLIAALRRCKHAADPKGDALYKRCVLISTAKPDQVQLYTTNSLLWVDTRAPAAVAAKGAIAVDCERLLGLVTALPEGEVGLTADDKLQLNLRSIGQRRRYKISGISATDFPSLKVPSASKSYPLVAEEFRAAVRRVRYAMNAHQPGADGVLLEAGGEKACRLYALDGRALMIADCTLDKAVAAGTMFLPRSAIEAVDHFCQDQKILRLAKDDQFISLETDSSLLTCALPHDLFPVNVLDYSRTLNKNHRDCTLLGHKLSEAAVALCAAHESEEGKSKSGGAAKLRLTLEGPLLSLALADNRHEAEDQLEVTPAARAEGEAAPVWKVLVDAAFLREALRDTQGVEISLGIEPDMNALAIRYQGYEAFIIKMDDSKQP